MNRARRRLRNGAPNQGGISLLEVLITVVILAVGLLGIATLQALGMQETHSAHARSQASLMAYDIMDRMRNNRTLALSATDYHMSYGDSTPFTNNCALTTCTPAETAAYDLAMWTANIAATLSQGEGEIVFDATNQIYSVGIRWRDLRRGDRDGDGNEDDDELRTFLYKGEL